MPACRRRERGAALLYALLLMVLAVTAGFLLSTSLAVDLRLRKADALRLRLAPLLDSAVAEALADLAIDPDAAGFEPHAFGGGSIESEIRTLPGGRREIRAAATYAGVTRAARAEVVFGPYGPDIVIWHSAGVASP